MENAIELPAHWRLTWHVSPLDENPEIVYFCFWDELQDWIADKELTCDAFDLNLCHIENLT